MTAEKKYGFFSIQFGTRLLCALLCCLIFIQQQAYSVVLNSPGTNTIEADQAADILQIRPEVDRLLQLEQETDRQAGTSQEVLSLKALILRKVLLGMLDVRGACSKVDLELTYTYAIIHRQERQQANVNQIFNLLNFAQLSTMLTMEPYLENQGEFDQSGLLTTISAGIGTGLPIIGILYNKFSKARNTAPPAVMRNFLDGGPVNAIKLPPLVERFLDSPGADGPMSRRQAMFALWKKRYKADVSHKDSVCSLRDRGGKSLGQLHTRMALLWSLRTTVVGFDYALSALLTMVKSQAPLFPEGTGLVKPRLKPGAAETARLLKIEPAVEELIRMNKENADDSRRIELETYLLERVLTAMLDTRIATNKIYEELNYAYDVVLAQLLNRREKGLQLNYNANFIQTGVLGAVAGLCYLKGLGKPGDELFIVQSGIGTLLSSLAVWQMRGPSRKVDTPPNSLARFFNSDPKNEYHFSPLIEDFLNAPSPESKDGKSRRDFLVGRWKERRVATINLDNEKNQEKLAATLPSMRDTIKVVQNRADLLESLKARLEEFNSDLFELLEATELVAPANNGVSYEITAKRLNPSATQMSTLLGIQPQVDQLVASSNGGTTQPADSEMLKQQLLVTRKIYEAALEVRKAVARLNLEIATETTARDRIARLRDLTVNMTNTANFFQLGILGMIYDGPLGLSANANRQYAGRVVNIVSGYLTGGLAGATIFEQPGLVRLNKAEPNTIGSLFGLNCPTNCELSPTVLKFLNSVAPTSTDGLTRKDKLVAYWNKTKAISVDISQPATLEKLAANGPSHHFWSETIKLLDNRIRMLYDIRAVIEQMDAELSEVVRAIN